MTVMITKKAKSHKIVSQNKKSKFENYKHCLKADQRKTK